MKNFKNEVEIKIYPDKSKSVSLLNLSSKECSTEFRRVLKTAIQNQIKILNSIQVKIEPGSVIIM